MNETKFRAWDKQDQRFIVHEQDFIPLKVTNIGVLKLDPTSKEERWILLEGERFIIEQSTGLKDKHGSEIFQGDIIKGTSYLYGYQLDNGKQFDFLGQVVWGDQADCGLCWLVDDNDGSWELKQTVHRNDIDYSTGEIIGSIHKNPELLK